MIIRKTNSQNNSTPLSFISFSSSSHIQSYINPIYIIIILSLFTYTQCIPSVSITSSSTYVGIPTNYSTTITNHENPTQIMTQFSSWAPWQNQPYTSNYQYYLTSGSYLNTLLTCRTIISSIIQCTFPTTSQLGSTIQLTLTNINNPSSCKPYNITYIFIYSNGTQIPISINLTVPNISQSQISLLNYNNNIGSISNNVNFIININYYFDYNTILQFTYNPHIINISLNTLTSAKILSNTVINNITNIIKLTNWTNTAQGLKLLSAFIISNPLASLQYKVYCILYHIYNNITYNIQSYNILFKINSIQFNSINISNTNIQNGKNGQNIKINNMSCNYTAIDQSNTSLSYTTVNYSISDITQSICISQYTNTTTNIKSCKYTTTIYPKQITSITTSISVSSTISLIITSYTYFIPLLTYLPLCSSVYYINLIAQQLSSTEIVFDVNKCGNAKTMEYNNGTIINIFVDNVQVGDIVSVWGMMVGTGGNVGGWTTVTNNGSTIYKYTIKSQNIINSSYLSIPLPYTNPSFTTSSNSITNLTITRILNSTQLIFAIIPLIQSSPIIIPLCPVLYPSSTQLYKFSLSSYITYQPNITTTIQFKNKIYDYTNNDYICINYYNYNNTLYLNSPNINKYIKVTLSNNNNNTNIIYNKIQIINNTAIYIYNITQLNNNKNSNNILYTLTLYNIINPSTIYPIYNIGQPYKIIVSFISAISNTIKQQIIIIFSSTVKTQYSYVPTTVNVIQNKLLPILTYNNNTNISTNNNNNITMIYNIYQNNKYIYYSNTNYKQTILTIKLPYICKQTNNNGYIYNIIWNIYDKYYNITLTQCKIGYIVQNINNTLQIYQYVNITNTTAVLSAKTMYGIELECMDNCYHCKYVNNINTCTQCLNISYTQSILLYNGKCYKQCPSSTYLDPITNNTCYNCHQSCLQCTNKYIYNCKSCNKYYTNISINISTTIGIVQYNNICGSICGQHMYYNIYNGNCQNCQIDCRYCINNNICYLCNINATMINYGVCDFTVCSVDCASCQGTMQNCTSCYQGKLLYQFTCVNPCPANTYQKQNITANGKSIKYCQIVNVPTLYFPACFCAVFLIFMVFVCNLCIQKGMTDSSPSRSNINILTYSAVILAFMELFAVFIAIAFTTTQSTKGLIITGLVIWIICNILFGIYYCKVVKNDETVGAVVRKMSQKSKCIYYGTIGISIGVTLRAYRVLYCGLFKGVAPFAMKKKNIEVSKTNQSKQVQKEKEKANRKNSAAKIANQDIIIKIQPQTNIKPIKSKNNGKNTSMSIKTVKNTIEPLPQPTNKKQQQNNQTLPLTLPMTQQNNKIQPQLISQVSSQQSIQQRSKFQLKRPQIIYITLGSILGSLLFLVSGVIQVIIHTYPAMLFSGLDLLLVTIASIIVTCLDMWAGIKRSYLMALEKGDANETMENLRMEEDIDQHTQQKMLFNNKVTQKINKSPIKKKIQQPPKPVPKKKYEPPKLRKRSPQSPNQQKVLSPKQKQFQQKVNKLKKIKNRYTDLYKRSKKSQQQQSSQQNQTQQIPDIKVFEDIQMYDNDTIQPEKKPNKLKANAKRMSSMNNMNNMRKTQHRNMFSQSNASFGRGTKMSWKVDDIFLGFKQSDEGTQFENKTIKLGNINNAPQQIYNISDKKFDKQIKSQEDQPSYIKSLERQNQQQKQEIKDQFSDVNDEEFQNVQKLSPKKQQTKQNEKKEQ